MSIQHLHLGILSVAIISIVVAIILPQWKCGSLFENCMQHGEPHEVLVAFTVVLVIGLLFLMIVFIMDCIKMCSTTSSRVEQMARLILLYMGSALTLIGVIIYTVFVVEKWSYFLSIVGTVLVFQLSLLTIMQTTCCGGSYSSGVPIRQVRWVYFYRSFKLLRLPFFYLVRSLRIFCFCWILDCTK